jgi:PAS domain-containing protein
MTRREADRFVLDAVRAYALGTSLPSPTGDMWVQAAIDAGVLSAVATMVSRAGHAVPAKAQEYRVLHAAVELAALHDLATLARVLEAVAVPWVVMKGPVLGRVVYASENAREYSDLDVLVSPGDFDSAVTALVDAGAELAAVDWGHVTRGRTAELALIMPGGTYLDLHWSLTNIGRIRQSLGIDTSLLLSRRVPRRVGWVDAYTLDDLDLVLHVLYHACLSGGHRLRWVLDTQQCLTWLTCSPETLAGRAAELGLSAPARAMVDRVARHLDPDALRWAHALQAPRAWHRVLSLIDRWLPPAPRRAGRPSAQPWYAATRRSSAASFRELARAAAAYLRHGGTPRNKGHQVGVGTQDAGYADWLATLPHRSDH